MRSVAYCRFSSDNQREESIDAQVRAITEYCRANGYILTHIYADRAESATTDDRAEFQRMMQDAKRKLFDVVLVHKFNRFARNRFDSAIHKKALRDYDIALISITQPLNDNPESVLLEGLLEGMDEYYSLNLGLEAMKGLRENAYQCKHTGGSPPLGYDLDKDKKYIINEQEAATVRLIFDMYVNEHSYGEIIQVLKERGLNSKRGQPISKVSLYDILNNEKYTGVYIFNRSASKTKKGTRNNRASKPESEIIRIEGGMPAIIDSDTWTMAHERMSDRKVPGRVYSKAVYPLSGLITCGYCGGSLHGQNACNGRNKAYYRYYVCSKKSAHGFSACELKRPSANVLESAVLAYLNENYFTPEGLDAMIKGAELELDEEVTDREIDAIEKNVRGIDMKIRNITNAIEQGMFQESMVKRMEELEQDKSRITRRLSQIRIERARHRLDRERIREIAGQFTKMEMSPENLKVVFKALIPQVTVYNDHIKIRSLLG